MACELLVNIDVDDLERAVQFYGDAFGLHVGRRFGSDGAEMLGANAAIYLLLKPPGSSAAKTTAQTRNYARHWTPLHLDFVVDDVEAAVRRAQAAGATLESAITGHDWGRIALLSDPFGHGLCILQFVGRGYDEIASATPAP